MLQLEQTEPKHLSSKTTHRSSESVYLPLKEEQFVNWLLPTITWAFQITSGYAVISSSSPKFLCLHIQEQKKYFPPPPLHHSPSLCDYRFFSKQLSLSYRAAPRRGREHLLTTRLATAFSYFRPELKPERVCNPSFYIIKPPQALPSPGLTLVSQRKESELLRCDVPLKSMAAHPNSVTNSPHAAQLFIYNRCSMSLIFPDSIGLWKCSSVSHEGLISLFLD